MAKLLNEHKPAIVIVELGANDGLRGLNLTASKKNLLTIISTCKSAKAQVLLIGMRIPPNYGQAYAEQFSAMYKDIAQKSHVPFVPFLLEGVADKQELFQADQLHLTSEAHPRILDNIWTHLTPLLLE
jgi:acyl-CoA thioesterase-1